MFQKRNKVKLRLKSYLTKVLVVNTRKFFAESNSNIKDDVILGTVFLPKPALT
jgi:hypothetical protein